MASIVSGEGSYDQRLDIALSCARCAMHLYEFFRPGDARLRNAIDLVARSFTSQSNGEPAAQDDASKISTAMWEVEKARAGGGGDEDGSVVLQAIYAVVLLCRARLGSLEGEPKDDLDIEAFQSCWHAARATELAFKDDQDTSASAVPTSVITREDLHALGQAFLLWLDYWNDRWGASTDHIR